VQLPSVRQVWRGERDKVRRASRLRPGFCHIAKLPIILSVRYKIAEKESASVLFYRYLLSAVSMTSVVPLTK
jgi:hypothetical protein